MSNSKRAVLCVTVATGLAASSGARAASFIHQPITLPHGEWALDVGLGIGRADRPSPLEDVTGLGFNLELRGGLTSSVELGVRTGIRVGSDGEFTEADRYGRTFQTETYGVDSR